MTFVTACPFCGHQCQAPDRALYGSGRCPKCSDYFTVVPVEREPRKSASARTATVPQTVVPTAPDQPAARPTTTAAGVPFLVPAVAPGRAAPEGLPVRSFDPVAMASVALAGVAALCWLIGGGAAWVVTPGVLAVAAGFWGLVRAEGTGLLPPAAGLLSATAVLLASALFGCGPAANGTNDGGDPGAIRVVPLTGVGVPGTPNDPEWVDASRAALQLGSVRVQVVGVTAAPGALNVSVRALRLGSGGGATGRPALTDRLNKPYPLRAEPSPGGPAPGKPSAALDFADTVYPFDLPAAGTEPYRFELPVDGTPLRFTIPAAMVRRDGSKAR